MNKLIYILTVGLFLNLNCGAQTETATLFDKSMLLQHIKTVASDAFEGRRTGTAGAIKTQKYCINQFNQHGVIPLGETYYQPFSFRLNNKKYHANNILGWVKGTLYPDKYIVISAHYDHEGIKNGSIYNGADDNASGLCALFSFAEYFKNNPPKHSVILAAFDAEELGIEGSKFFVNNPIVPLKQIKVNLNMDMISRSTKNDLFAVGTVYNDALKSVIVNNTFSNKIKLLTGHDEGNGSANWTYASDHGQFHKKGIPFLYFGVDDHEDYHQPTDDFENIQPEFYIEAVHVIISVFQNIDAL